MSEQFLIRGPLLQKLTLGLFRSDYMVHVDKKRIEENSRSQRGAHQDSPDLSLKQVEFNTYSVAGGAHSNKTAELHQYVVFPGVPGHLPG